MATDLHRETLKASIATANALATAVGLNPSNSDSLNTGGEIRLSINPTSESSAKSADSNNGSIAKSESYGLGIGTSQFYSQPGQPYYQPSGFNSLTLGKLIGASGRIDGISKAIARTTSSTDASTDATAINIGLAHLGLEAPDASVLQIGTAENPFEAIALAASTSNAEEDCDCSNDPLSHLNATAIVRGVENPLDGSKTVLGQPVANVAATAHVAPLTTNSAVRGGAKADAIALQGLNLKTTPTGNGDGTATIVGNAAATTGLKGLIPKALSPKGEEPALKFEGQAIGIDAGTDEQPGRIKGNSSANNIIQGTGFVELDIPGDEYLVNSHLIDEHCVETDLTAIGIRNADITTGLGDDAVIGMAGIDTGVAILKEGNSEVDLAAIRNTDISTGLGNDTVVGQITTLPTADEFDTTTSELAFNGFEGGTAGANTDQELSDANKANTVRTGIGDDVVSGSARDYTFEGGIGNDNIDLDNAWNTSLFGSLGNDRVVVNGTSHGLELFGGSGRDEIVGGSGDGGKFDGADRIEGGDGVDVSKGQGGQDTFVYSTGNSAWRGTENSEINEILLDEESWSELTNDEKNVFLGETERILDFTSGRESDGDKLELSTSLGSITSSEWKSKGVLMTAEQAVKYIHADRVGVVVDTLANIQNMGLSGRSYAISISEDGKQGMLLYDADGDFSHGAQVVSHLSGDLSNMDKSNISFA